MHRKPVTIDGTSGSRARETARGQGLQYGENLQQILWI